MKWAWVLLLVACNDAGLSLSNDGGMGGDLARPLAGEPCQAGNECPQDPDPQYKPMCLTPPIFPNGYCVQPCAHGFGCPSPGMSCRPLSAAASAVACFKDCTTDLDCRVAEGYHCCPPWNPLGGPASVCYPGKCPKL
jgi:hypothetical protein